MKHSRHPAGAVWDDLTPDQRSDLRDSLSDGFDPNRPILVTNDDLVVDGWHRLSLCEELGITPTTFIVPEDEILPTIARRHCDLSTTRMLSPGARAIGIVQTMLACGRSFAKPGQRGAAEGNKAITIDEVRTLARCGHTSARRAIDQAKGVDRSKPPPRPPARAPEPGSRSNGPETTPDTQPAPTPPKAQITPDLDHVSVLERARDVAVSERDELQERLALVETQLGGDEQAAVDKVQQMAAEIEALKAQVASWQEKYARLKRERDAIARKLKSKGG